MNRQWNWLWPLGMASLLVVDGAAHQSRAQDLDKKTVQVESETRTIKDELVGSEPRDRVRPQSPHKSYEHKLVKGKNYLIDLTSDQFDPFVRLENPKGVQVASDDDSGGDLNAQLVYQAEESGTYHIIATGFGKATRGKFTLSVREVAVRQAKPSTLKFDEGATVIKDQVTAADGTDPRGRFYKAYDFAGKTTMLYRVQLKGVSRGQLQLQDETGRSIRQSTGTTKGGVTLAFRPRKDGNYRLLVGSGESGKVGDFSLSVTPTEPQPAKVVPIELEKPIKLEAQFAREDGTDRDGKYCRIYSFKGVAGKEYRFEARGNADPLLQVEDKEGKGLQNEDYGDPGYSHLSFRPGKTETYHLVITAGKADQMGGFTLTAGERLSSATPLEIAKGPVEVSGKLDKDNELDAQGRCQKVYVFKAEKGKIYRFKVAGDFTPFIGVDPVPTQVPKGEIPPSLVPGGMRIFIPFQTGNHYLTVSGLPGQTGSYTLTASTLEARLAVATAPKFREVITKVANLKGVITEDEGLTTNGQPYALVELKTEPKRLYEAKLTVQPGSPMPAMQLQGLKGEVIRTAQPGINNAMILNHLGTKAGDYRVAIIGFLGQKTQYNLTITESEYLPPQLAVEKIVASVGKPSVVTKLPIQEEGINLTGQQYQYIALKAETKKLYSIKLPIVPSGNLPQLRLEGLKGEFLRAGVLIGGNVLSLTYPVMKNADYRIAVVGLQGQDTLYKLSITESDYVPSKVEKLVVSAGKVTSVSNDLNEADPRGEGDINKLHKVYTFDAKQGVTYQIDLHSNAFDAYLYLKDASEVILAQNDDFGGTLDSRITFTMPKTGTYKIIATSLGGNGVGPYTLTVQAIGGASPK